MSPVPCRGLTPLSLLALVTQVVAQDGAATSPVAGGPEAIFSSSYDLTIVHVNTAGHPTNVVPGLGVPFKSGGITTAFGRPITSGTGAHFAINCETSQGALLDDIILRNGVVLIQEGSPTPWAGGAFNVGTIDEEFGLNDAGDVVLGNNTSATVNDDDLVLFQGGVWTLLAQEAGSVTPHLPSIVGGTAGTWDDAIDSPRISNTGVSLWRATGIDGLTTGATNDAVVVLGGGLALQKGVDVPLGQAGGATDAWENFDLNDIYVSPNGATVLVQGDLLGATTGDDVVVLNGVVIVQENQILAGSSFAEPVDLEGIVKPWVDRGGNWYVRGNNDVTETDWIYRNGVVVAESSGTNEVVAGSGEFWDDATFADCFFCFDGNTLGQFVMGGVTSAPAAINGVIVFDDGAGFRRVVAREGDAIDMDGNGLFDDDRFFNTFGNDDVLLLDDGTIILTATLKNGAGTAVDQGLFRLTPRSASCTFRNGTGVNPVGCTCTTLPVLGTTWNLSVTGGVGTLATFAFASETPFGPFPLFGGELLIGPSVVGIATSIFLPNEPRLYGVSLSVQGVRLDLVGPDLVFVLTNAQDAVVGI